MVDEKRIKEIASQLMSDEAEDILFLLEEQIKYEKGFDILCDRFDYLPEEDKPIIDEELSKVGL